MNNECFIITWKILFSYESSKSSVRKFLDLLCATFKFYCALVLNPAHALGFNLAHACAGLKPSACAKLKPSARVR